MKVVIYIIYKLIYHLNKIKFKIYKDVYEKKILEINKIHNGIVLSGPFKGMKFDVKSNHGSVRLAKLLGIYEFELHSIIYDIINKRSKKYELIIDVGTADGYYILGLAKKIEKEIEFIGYEIDSVRRNVCNKLYKVNGLESSFNLKGECSTKELLKDIKGFNSGLIIIDCEGFELELLNNDLISRFKSYDFIIEVHELNKWTNKTSSEEIFSLFSNSHDLKFINIKKNKPINNFNTNSIPDYIIQDLLNEGREISVGWIYAESRRMN